ncbi:uncharacterized protein LOC113231872 [Hyposmocoma kahamanoa]|uniref:uncharacterized protein LOC113231872 n=1 Tax=Hyposmocoma kahamanoa TaxID=1477025 RepID=UPI000E6DA223|nr:uncharacterized protein LOC113231872 [Hyposmocoma kahamanoa]
MASYFWVATDKLEVFVTDYIKIFYTYFTEASFVACLEDSNLGLQMNKKVLFNAGKRILTNPGELKRVSIEEEEKSLCVKLLTDYCGIPLKLNLKLTEGSKELYFQKVTRVLLQVIQDLTFSQQELKKELFKKDEEIEEYKCEGGEIALRHLKTIPFNEKEHMNRHTAFSAHFGTSNIFQILLQKSVVVPDMKKIDMKQEESDFLETQDTNAILNNSSIKIEQNIKEPAATILKMETNVLDTDVSNGEQPKIETEASVKIENMKLEQSNSRISRPMVSPHKRKRSKLNY